jgi:hypothetical protein
LEPLDVVASFHHVRYSPRGEVLLTIFRILATAVVRVVAIGVLLSLVYGSAPSAAQGTKAPAPGDNPSDKLGKSGGVISPGGNVDPNMQVAPPDPGPTSTAVIPPPGSPGGNPKVAPK